MAHALRLVDGKGESLLTLLGQREVGGGADPLQGHSVSEKLLAELPRVDAPLLEKAIEGRLSLAQHPGENMLG